MESTESSGPDLLLELGLSEDEDELLAIQREALEAEMWLEKRKDQERRDEALARALQESLYEPVPPQRPSLSPSSMRAHQFDPANIPLSFPTPQPRSNPIQQPRNSVSRTVADICMDIVDLTGSEPYIPSLPLQFTGVGSRNATPSVPSSHEAIQHRQQQRFIPLNYSSDPYSQTYRRAPSSAIDVEEYGQYTQVPGDHMVYSASYQLNNSAHYQPPHTQPYKLTEMSQASSSPLAVLSNNILGGKGTSLYNFDDEASNPAEMTKELKNLLNTIRPDQDLNRNREGTPEAMKCPLMEHQKLGLTWMKSMEESSNKGGILADDMGLGKTIQALALIVSRPSTDSERKTTLIVAPVSLMHQWKREIEQKLKKGQHQLSVYILHGDKRTASFSKLRKYDVVLTSYGTLSSEFKRKEEFDQFAKTAPSLRDSHPLSMQLPVLGDRSKWYRVILDEAQCIKNRNTKAARACTTIRAAHRWCMSGTPMMNNVTELYSLLRFLRIGPYNKLETFNTTFTRPLKSSHDHLQQAAMKQLQALLKAILLRRTKSSKIDGKPILQLPPRTTEKVHAVFSEDEQKVYRCLETKTQFEFNRYLNAGTVGTHYSNVLVLLLRLRQACCHPHLIEFPGADSNVNASGVDLVANAKLLGTEVVRRLRSNEDSECPVCIDAMENAIILFPCGHNICVECFAKISDPSRGLAQGHDGTVEIKCPNCRTKIDPQKITDKVSFKKVHISGEIGDAFDAKSDGDDTDSEDDYSDADSLRDFIVDDNDSDLERPRTKKRKRSANGKGKSRKDHGLAELKKTSMKNAKAKRRYLRRLEKTWETSAKIEKALEILREIEGRGEGEKTIIFSQFTTLLDLLEVPIGREGWGYKRYDGSMSPIQRNEAVLEFTDNSDCTIMLVSLKAGNAGLNLVAASQVIIFDPFWNPYIEEQAIDRAHRIGQTRPVMVHRILVENTVEDRILALQEKKRALIENALDEKASRSLGRLGTRELAFLFGISR